MCSCVTLASHNCAQVLSQLTKKFAVLGETATNIIAKSTNTTIKMHVDTNDGGCGGSYGPWGPSARRVQCTPHPTTGLWLTKHVLAQHQAERCA